MSASPERPLSLRCGLRRLSGGLLVYGALGLVVALLGLLALVWVSGRIDALAQRAEVQVDAVIASLDETANVLTVTGATAGSFGGTLSATASTVGQAAETVRSVKPRLTDLEAQFRSINILGNQPLSNAADVVAGDQRRPRGSRYAARPGRRQPAREPDVAGSQRRGAHLAGRPPRAIWPIASRPASGRWETSRRSSRSRCWCSPRGRPCPAVGAIGLGLWLRKQLGPAEAGPEVEV